MCDGRSDERGRSVRCIVSVDLLHGEDEGRRRRGERRVFISVVVGTCDLGIEEAGN